VKVPVVLVIEDSPSTRKIARLTLGNEGFTVIEAGDGAEGLELASTTPPDLILQDLLLPDMDGFTLVSRLRAKPELVGVPIIAFSGFLSRLEQGRAAAAGFTDFVPKPVEPSRLVQVVRAHLPSDLSTPEEIGRGRRVLVVDDDPVQLKLARIRLTGLGFTVATATNGVEALEVLQRDDTEAVVSDVLMPSLDGFGLCAAMRQAPHVSQLPIILVSSNYIDDADRDLALKMGATAFVVRTPNLAEVIRALDAALDAPSGAPMPSVHSATTEHHERVLRQLERQVAINAAFAHRSSMHASMLSVVAGVSESLTKRRSAEDAAPDILASLLEASGVSIGALFERNAGATAPCSPALDDLVLRAQMGFSAAMGEEVGRFFGHPEIFERAVTSKSPVVVGAPDEGPAGRDLLARAGLKSALLVPFLSQEECLGVLLLASKSRDLTESDWIPFARTIAVQIGQALSLGRAFSMLEREVIERKQAEEEIRRRATLSALGAAVGLALANSDTLAHALQQCAEALVTHLGAAFARIWTLNDAKDMLELQASAGLYTHLNGPHGRVPVGQSKIGRIAQNRRAHLTNTVIGDPEVSDQDWARREEMVAFAGHPLIIDGCVVGVMALFARHELSNDVLVALASVADHVAVGVERHRSAEALRTTEARMRSALQNANVGIWDLDYVTGGFRGSEIFESHLGLSPGTFGGTLDAMVNSIHPLDRDAMRDTIAEVSRLGGDFSAVYRTLRPDGSVGWVNGIGRVELGADGQPVRGVGVSLDVTQRQRLEEQFQQAQKMEAVGRLAGGVAHDFNNLLTVILGFCELSLGDLEPGDPRRADIGEIRKAGERAAGLTRQLLAFSRKQIIEPTLLDLNVIATDMRAMLGRLIGEDVKVVLALQPELAAVTADRGQVEQVVMNLAVNARDAMPKGGTLTIQTANVELDEHYAEMHRTVKPGAYVALTVTDTGTGMTPEVQARLFEPFFTTKEVGKGTGLGMATVYGIVTRSGGNVGVYSEIGKGTAFKVYFPRADAADMITEAPTSLPPSRVGTQTVLVVEDEDGLRELTKRLLLRQGYTVLVAANADEALQLFEMNQSIDVLLTDVVMPGTSGPELTRRLVEQHPALRVIYMSGYTEEAIVQHGVLKPGIAFLNKPFNSETLGAKLHEVLER
jgi:CheY-like chemotaxis protein